MNHSQPAHLPHLSRGIPMKTQLQTAPSAGRSRRLACAYAGSNIDQPYDLPDAEEPSEDLDETLEPDDFTLDEDDEPWEVFVADDDEVDFEPDPRDFDSGWTDAWEDEQ
jgi:hypothetical protein